MSAFDRLPRTSFGAVQFPAEVIGLHLPGDHHVHKYPHTKKGVPEKLGSGLIEVTLRASFQDRFPAYPGLYPGGMLQMLAYAISQETQTLVHRSAGSFPAFIVDWNQQLEAKLRSGEKVEIKFLEDASSAFSVSAIAPSSPSTGLTPSAAQLATDLASINSQLSLTENDLSVFDALQEAVQTVQGFNDTKQLYGNRYAASVTQVINLCQQLHDATPSLQDVRSWPVVDDILQLWSMAVGIQNDLAQQNATLQRYNVPFTQPIAQIAINIYGDVSRQSDLLALNSDTISNAMAVRAGTSIRYYPN